MVFSPSCHLIVVEIHAPIDACTRLLLWLC